MRNQKYIKLVLSFIFFLLLFIPFILKDVAFAPENISFQLLGIFEEGESYLDAVPPDDYDEIRKAAFLTIVSV